MRTEGSYDIGKLTANRNCEKRLFNKFWGGNPIASAVGAVKLEPVESINTTKIETNANYRHIKLTSAEMGKLWVTYVGNTMAKCVLRYYLQHVEDQDIKKVLENALTLSESLVKNTKDIFIGEEFPLPVGFKEEDVNLGRQGYFQMNFIYIT